MQVNGRQVDMLSWLKETGGNSSVKRFKTASTTAAEPAAGDRLTLSSEAAAALRTQVRYNSAGSLLSLNGVPPTTEETMNELLQRINPLNDLPPTAADLVNAESTVRFNPGQQQQNTVNARGIGNVVDFTGSGTAANNTVMVQGNANYVRAYNGGQNGNTLMVQGDDTRIYAGSGSSSNMVDMKGSGNTVSLGEQNNGNSIRVSGSNVTLNMSGNASGSNGAWTVSVAASNVDVSILDGKGSVNMADALKDTYKISIDNEKRTITVSAAAGWTA